MVALCDALPADEENRQLATAESISFMTYIWDTHGEDALALLADAYLTGADCAEGPSRALGRSLQQVEQEWLAARAGGRSWPQLLRDSAGWLLLLLLGFLFSGLLLLPVAKGKP